MHRNFTNDEIKLLKKDGFEIKNNLQDAYKTFSSPIEGPYLVHISLVNGNEYFITKEKESAHGESPYGFESIEKLLFQLERHFLYT